MVNPYLILPLIILLPLVPAYLLYRNLPSRAMVSGPLQGFSIKLSGAFAGYFALVLLVFFTHSWWNPVKQQQEEWKVSGQINYAGGDARTLADKTTIFMEPPSQPPQVKGGTFWLTIELPLGTNKSTLPTLGVDVPGYKFEDVHLSELKTSITDSTIHLETPINLTKEPSESGQTPYNGDKAENPQLEGGASQ